MSFGPTHLSSRALARGGRAVLLTSTIGLLLAGGGLFHAASASAAEIPDAVSNITVANSGGTSPISRFENVTVRADWSVPDDSTPGDTFSMTLPEELTGLSSRFPLQNPDGETFGECVVSRTAVDCTLSELVLTRPLDVGGTLFFSGRFTDLIQPGETNVLSFDTGLTIEDVTVEVGVVVGYSGNDFRKSALVGEDGSVRWFIELPQGPDGLEQDLTDVVVTDVLDDSLAFVGTQSVRLASGTGLNPGGTAPLYDRAVDPSTYSVTIVGQTATISIPLLEAGSYYRIVVDTVVVAGSQPPYSNSATLIANELSNNAAVVSTVDYTAGGDGHGSTAPPIVTTPVGGTGPGTGTGPGQGTGPSQGTGPGQATGPAQRVGAELAATGLDSEIAPALSLGGLALLLGGAALVLVGRRHTRAGR